MRQTGFAIVALSLAVLALLAAPMGCNNRAITSICHQTCACSPCTKSDLDACITTGEKADTKAQQKNCSDTFDKLLTCLDENLSCQQGIGVGKCAKQEAALTKCAGIGNPFTTPCAEAIQKVSACSGNPVQPGQPGQPSASSCTGLLACQSLCLLAQPCDVVIGMTFSQSFQDCQIQCASGPPGSTTGTGFSGGTGAGAPH